MATSLAAWLGLTSAAAASVAAYNHKLIADTFQAEARTLHRVVSQRADQHDAHLTSLAAILAGPEQSTATLRAVAEAVLRFYPRITSIDVISFEPTAKVAFTTREVGLRTREPYEVVRLAEGLQPGQAIVAPGGGGGDYDLVKRVPSGALVMSVNGGRLIEPEVGPPPDTTTLLSDHSGREIVRVARHEPAKNFLPVLLFEKELGSRSQPLLLTVTRQPTVAEVLPLLTTLLIATGAGACVLLGAFVLRERRAALAARQRASILAHEARLSHAMRINMVGEMASGIAHELTQPLTAILSQSQAGLRLAHASAVPQEIAGVLEANARLAKRAGDILARLRAYVSNKALAPEPVALNGLVQDVVELARADLEQREIAPDLALSPDDPVSLVDRVAIEQVLHNLLRNAADAVESGPGGVRAIHIATATEGGQAVITVRDGGPGISPEHLPRLFEPFFTTKEGGMGLGLPLSERLVESFGGQITAANHPEGGAEFRIRLPLTDAPARKVAA
jgi:signal transduction histidine kinase